MTDSEHELRTDHLAGDLAVRSARGSAVMVGAQALKVAVGMGATVVLARLLTPGDFGLVAMAVAAVGLFSKVNDAGMSAATVQSRDLRHDQATTLFWISAGLACMAALATLALAPVVGWFYRDSRLTLITAALAIIPLVNGLTLQQQAVMSRQMRFGALALMDGSALAVGVAVAVTLALAGAGSWALVGQEVAYSFAYGAVVWSVSTWRPGRPRRGSGARPLVAFGLNLSGARVLNFLAVNLDTVFVGRFHGALEAGTYDRAFRLLTLPMTLLNQPLGAVAVPALSRLRADPARFRRYYRTWMEFAFGLTMPLVVFLFVDAERAVRTILGDQWMGLVPMYQALAPAAFVGRLSQTTNWLYLTTGRTDRQLRWGAFALVPTVVAYAIGVRWGAMGVAVAHSFVVCALWYPGLVYACRATPVRPNDLLGAMARPAVTSLSAGLGLVAVMRVSAATGGTPVQLLVDFIVYAACYGLAWLAMPGGRRSVQQIVSLTRDALSVRALKQARPSEVRGEA